MSSVPIALLTAAFLSAAPPDKPAATPPDSFRPDPAWKSLGHHLWYDARERQLVIRARVALREGPLEHLLCLKGTKEHEAVLATEASPRAIHAGLLLTGAETGHPVRFVPKFEPPTGSPIAITLRWKEGEKTREVDARRVIRSEKSKTPLDKDWVFAGSELYVDPVSKKPAYAADDGDLITVANFANSILDLPFASTSNDSDRTFVANTDQIPPRDTLVLMFLRPRPAAAAPPRR